MKTEGIVLRKTFDNPRLPDGDYPGFWGGYKAVFEHDGEMYEVQTRSGIRTPKAPCVVSIRMGSISVDTVESRAQHDE